MTLPSGVGGATRVVRVKAFAKINLGLRVIATRADGYHELETTFQTVRLHDTLTFSERTGPFELACDDAACPLDATNLVWTATDKLWRAKGHRTPPTGIHVRIVKRIPMRAGLGGGSSDAAAAIRALARLWQMDVGSPRVRRVAAELGADVPFFLQGGTAFGRARGDVMTPMPDIEPAWVVLVLPAFGVRTVDAYRWWDEDSAEAAHAPGVQRPRDGRTNDLEAPVARRHPQIPRIVGALRRLGASHAAMSGSGSAVFGLFSTRVRADEAAAALAARSRRTMVTRSLSRADYRTEAGV